MRRMYSEQELTKIIGDVFDSKIEDGSFDESIADYVDEYLVEHPVDITALAGKDVSLKSLTSTNNVSVGGNLSVTGNVSGNLSVTGNISGASIIENMSGYSYYRFTIDPKLTFNMIYAGACKNGNKLTLVAFFELTRTDDSPASNDMFYFIIPKAVADLIYPFTIDGTSIVSLQQAQAYSNVYTKVSLDARISKTGSGDTSRNLVYSLSGVGSLPLNTKHIVRIETTFLLSENLAN